VTKKMECDWHLRGLMAERGMFQTSDLGRVSQVISLGRARVAWWRVQLN
jgi:hypothetical protein